LIVVSARTAQCSSRASRRPGIGCRSDDGFTIVEVLVASLVLTIGIVAMFSNFTSGQKLGNSAEAHQSAVAVAEGELERIRTLPWKEMAMHEIPARSSETTNPTHNEVSPATATCTSMGGGKKELENCFEWKSGTKEPMVYDTTNAESKIKDPETVKVASVVKGATTRLTFKVYRFITWVTDKECKVATCEGQRDSKRVTVAVTGSNLNKPVYVMSIVNDRELAGTNPLAKVKCEEEAVEVECISQK
jgi:Tfp pilus assembly protein PilV